MGNGLALQWDVSVRGEMGELQVCGASICSHTMGKEAFLVCSSQCDREADMERDMEPAHKQQAQWQLPPVTSCFS